MVAYKAQAIDCVRKGLTRGTLAMSHVYIPMNLQIIGLTGQLLPGSALVLLINSHHLEPKTSGGGGELRIMG